MNEMAVATMVHSELRESDILIGFGGVSFPSGAFRKQIRMQNPGFALSVPDRTDVGPEHAQILVPAGCHRRDVADIATGRTAT